MTEEQKDAVRMMRFKGLGYGAISKTLNVKEKQIQTYCKTHGLAGTAELTKLNYPVWCQQHNRCMICGMKMKQPKTGRRKIFCSGRCRTRYCRERKELEE